MFFALITLITALAMAGTAATFAIFGIVAIFSGMPVHAAVMGTVIETGKVVGVSWLYRNWHQPTNIKYAMLPLVLLAMLLTSLGIFGLLSKAYFEQTQPIAISVLQLERVDDQIALTQRDLNRAQSALDQLDQAVNEFVERGFVTRGLDARAQQQNERQTLAQLIEQSIQQLDELSKQRLLLMQEVQAVEFEVGPLRYLAELVYGPNTDNLEQAVRWVIIAFIFVFDPMAILLLMAANYSMSQPRPFQPQHAVTHNAADDHKVADDDYNITDDHGVVDDKSPAGSVFTDLEQSQKHQTSAIVTVFEQVSVGDDETPEHFVRKLIDAHGDPGRWEYNELGELVTPDGIISKNISEEDARLLIELALAQKNRKVIGKLGEQIELVMSKKAKPHV